MNYFDDFRENISRIQEGRSAVDMKDQLSARSIFSAAFLPHQKFVFPLLSILSSYQIQYNVA